MGKGRRNKANRSPDQVKLIDAENLVGMAQRFASVKGRQRNSYDVSYGARVTATMLRFWRGHSQTILRLDDDFLTALLQSDTDVVIDDGAWLDRSPYPAVAACFAEPISVHDGERRCHYYGFFATGVNHTAMERSDRLWSECTGLNDRADSVRCLWVYNEDGKPAANVQTTTITLRGAFGQPGQTLSDLIAGQQRAAEYEGRACAELPMLTSLSTQLLLYLTAGEPDIDWVPPAQVARTRALTAAQVANTGWRVGAALRASSPGRPVTSTHTPEVGRTGRHLAGHLRRAHWHRVRVVTRDADGRPVGHRSGVQGVDWQYEVRWYPPTPVNSVPTPADNSVTVRDVLGG